MGDNMNGMSNPNEPVETLDERAPIDSIDESALPLVPWLDAATAQALRRLVTLVAQEAPDALAIILFGSVARHEERPLTDPNPSDVDVLVLFSPTKPSSTSTSTPSPIAQDVEQDTLTTRQQTLLSWAVVRALHAFPETARDLNVTGALTHFARWGSEFVEHVARDGILLWARGPLPPALRQIETRGVITPSSTQNN